MKKQWVQTALLNMADDSGKRYRVLQLEQLEIQPIYGGLATFYDDSNVRFLTDAGEVVHRISEDTFVLDKSRKILRISTSSGGSGNSEAS